MLLFFISSRRRHTRLQGDWSSDVCSSDLGVRARARVGQEGEGGDAGHRARRGGAARGRAALQAGGEEQGPPGRSEERRVGKEWKRRESPTCTKQEIKERCRGGGGERVSGR